MILNPANRLNNVRPSLIRKFKDLCRVDSKTIDMSLGELGFTAPKAFREAGAAAFAEGRLRYTPNAGLLGLREAIAERHNITYGGNYSAKNVVVTSGVEQALFNTFFSFLNPGDEVLVPRICFPAYTEIPKMMGATSVPYDLDEKLDINLNDLVSKLGGKTKFVVINSPGNPTGRVISDDVLFKLSRAVLEKSKAYVLSDEVYSTILFDGLEITSIAKYLDNVIIANGISKSAAATGARCGWTISPEEAVAPITMSNQWINSCASVASQKAAVPVVMGECRAEEREYVVQLQRNRDALIKELTGVRGLNLNVPQGAFYCFADTLGKKSWDVATNIFEKGNVVVIPGEAFGSDRHIRLSFAGKFEDVVEGARRIKGVMAK